MLAECEPLRILSVYLAPDGEISTFGQGQWSVFLRTGGCSVGCLWCDTKYSWSPKRGVLLSPGQVVKKVEEVGRGCNKVTLTGGEPLEQPTSSLLYMLYLLIGIHGYRVTIETSGCDLVPDRLHAYSSQQLGLIFDYKLPSSHSTRPPVMANYSGLKAHHVVKFVVQDEKDFLEMERVALELRTTYACRAMMAMSPMVNVKGCSNSRTLAEWVERMKQADLQKLGVGLNLQLHKIIYPQEARDEEQGGADYSKQIDRRVAT